MRLSENNISFVKIHTNEKCVPYSYFVSMKSNCVSDCRSYSNYENGKTTDEYYPFKNLPLSVQKFINHSGCRIFDINGSHITFIHEKK